ncbi:MAG: N-acetyltransferase [Planctomycetota bacterium]|jgi:amino-acid N-acetyltransferase
MDIRKAKITDVPAIGSLINQYAEQDKMLFRSMAEVYENLQSFIVAERDGSILGCCALQIIWSDLAEIKSLAVDQTHTASGIGRGLITETVKQARQLGISELFALTLTPGFFEKMGFKVVEKQLLPMKVWSDCARCPKQQNCDETAVIKTV